MSVSSEDYIQIAFDGERSLCYVADLDRTVSIFLGCNAIVESFCA